jgi:hypothetical protein
MPIVVGDMVPALTLPRLDGGPLDLSQPRGRRMLLFFWGSW